MAGKIRIIMVSLLLFMGIASFSVPVLAAQNPEFYLDMNSLNLQKGVSCELVVSMINVQEAEIIGIDGLEHFDVLSQSQSYASSTSHNVTTYQVRTHYTIMPKATGSFTLKANIHYNGQSYETNALQVTVTEGSVAVEGADLFIKTVLSKEEAFLGEKIIMAYELYARDTIESINFMDYTGIDGIMTKEVRQDQVKMESLYIDGTKYTKYDIKQLILDPINPGTCVIPAFNLQVNVISDNTGFGFPGMGGLFGGTVTKYVQTEEKILTVKPLPVEGRPAHFSGIVGELALDAAYSRNEVNYGDSVVLQITASGHCNLDGVNNLINDGLTGFTVYENLKSTSETLENNQYQVKKSFEAILIPEKTGELAVPPIALSYFNPVSESYETAQIPGETIHVLGEMPMLNTNEPGQAVGLETVQVNQVRYGDADSSNGYITVQLPKRIVYILLSVAAGLLVLMAVWFWLRTRKKRDTTVKSLYRQLMGTADLNEIYNLFNTMMKHCYHVNIKSSPRHAIQRSLPNADLAAQVVDVMDYMESAGASGEKEPVPLKNKIKDIYRSKFFYPSAKNAVITSKNSLP